MTRFPFECSLAVFRSLVVVALLAPLPEALTPKNAWGAPLAPQSNPQLAPIPVGRHDFFADEATLKSFRQKYRRRDEGTSYKGALQDTTRYQNLVGKVFSTPEEMVAVYEYTKYGSMDANSTLRSGDPKLLAKHGPFIRVLLSGLNRLPDYVGEVRRVIVHPPVVVDSKGKIISTDPDAAARNAAEKDAIYFARYKEYCDSGKPMTEPAFLSTSTAQFEALEEQLNESHFHIVVRSQHGKNVSMLSDSPDEAEVLFIAGTRFRVTRCGATQLANGRKAYFVRLEEAD